MPQTQTIIVVDDESDIRDVIYDYLGSHGYTVHQAADGRELRRILQDVSPELVLLDINLPGEDGLSLARYLRDHHDLGIIMVTAAGEVVDRVVGLEVGADDYLSKPFDLRELLARVRSVLRRTEDKGGPAAEPAGAETRTRHRVGTFTLDCDARSLLDASGRHVPITSMEFDLLSMFVERPNRVLSRDQILQFTQNRDWDPYDRSIDIRITRLRRKIEQDPSHPTLIKTVRGAGYMYTPQSD